MVTESYGLPQVVTAADERYLPYLGCLLVSLGEHGAAGQPVEITVFHRGLALHVRRELTGLLPRRLRLHWVEPDAVLLRSVGAPTDLERASPHYFRLLAPLCLPDHDRALYLDADTMVLSDLTPLWSTDLQGRAVAAVRDYLPRIGDAVSNWRELNLDPNAPYFNSGVMVMDLARWRDEAVPQRTLEVCRVCRDHLIAHGSWPQHDQYGLNVVLHGRWKDLDPALNHGADLPPRAPRIVHFIGNGKVGLPTCQPFFSRLFLDTLRRTPYHGCRFPLESGDDA
jgi:lipopolysaccharide biosynthesis glycosyltransferase